VSSHLGAFTSGLVDGELRHDQREQVLAHLAHCAPCRSQVDAERRFKSELRTLAVAPVPAALADRLLLLSEDVAPAAQPRLHRLSPRLLTQHPLSPHPFSPHPPSGGLVSPRVLRRAAPPRPPSTATAPGHPPRGRPAGRLRRTAVGGALLAMGLGGTLALGGPAPRGPSAPVNPTSPALVVDYTSTTPRVPFSDPDVVSASLITRR
jgi:hypothetical protein